MVFCINCGQPLATDDEKFCSNCDQNLSDRRSNESSPNITNNKGDVIGVGVWCFRLWSCYW